MGMKIKVKRLDLSSMKRPSHAFFDNRIRMRGPLLRRLLQLLSFRGCWAGLGAQRIANGNGQISKPSHMPDAPDGTALGQSQKCGLIPLHQMHQFRRAQTMTLVKIRQCTALCKFVPWTHELAVVTAVNTVAYQRPELRRNRPLVLDGQVGNAPACIQLVRRHDSLCGASADAGAATAAMVTDGFIRRERHVDKYLTQKEK